MMGKANAWRERYYKKLTYAVAEGSMCWIRIEIWR